MSALLPPPAVRARIPSTAEIAPNRTMREAPAELVALRGAMRVQDPACRGDDRFTMNATSLTGTQANDMRGMCAGCGIRAACRAYADAARPTAGFWAGKGYR